MKSGSNDSESSIENGFFEIKYEENGVFLIVYPSVGKGKRIEANMVIDRLVRKKVSNFFRDEVNLAVMKADKTPIKIADFQDEAKVNAVASVIISPDKMKAFLSIIPPEGGINLSLNEMVKLLTKQGVIYGINKTTLETISEYPVFNEMTCVAEGSVPSNGTNGKINFLFDISKERKPSILEDGRVDYRELNLIESVEKGQKLCSLVPPSLGTPGKTVFGTDIPALNGKPAVLPRGKNVEISEDGETLLASISGQVNYVDGKVNVFASYEVHADVDNSTGNISFIGNVSVRGNVLSGFSIEAGGNVEVWGVVEGATIKASGDIILRRGMQGLGKGILISGGDIIARYIEHSIIIANGNIKAEAIMHSNVKCGNKLELSGNKGLLVGGSYKVGREVIAKVIGSHLATVTDVEVGVDPTLRENYKSIKDEIASIDSDLRKADQAITLLKKLESANLLTPEKKEILDKSLRTKVFYSNKIVELKEEAVMLEAKLQQESYGKVRAFNMIYPGTKVAIGTCMMFVKETLQYCTLYRDGADIRVGSIDK
jgi:uncharacterized protein (DUF342 family)